PTPPPCLRRLDARSAAGRFIARGCVDACAWPTRNGKGAGRPSAVQPTGPATALRVQAGRAQRGRRARAIGTGMSFRKRRAVIDSRGPDWQGPAMRVLPFVFLLVAATARAGDVFDMHVHLHDAANSVRAFEGDAASAKLELA